jgi:hypothetical protein
VALVRQGNRRKAAVFFKRALAVDPFFTPARRNLERWPPEGEAQR